MTIEGWDEDDGCTCTRCQIPDAGPRRGPGLLARIRAALRRWTDVRPDVTS